MGGWVHFTKDYDHRWSSGAVTAFKAGITVHVKDDVLKAATGAGAARKASKPKEGEEGHVTTPTAAEGKRLPRGEAYKVVTGGHGYDSSGNPNPVEGAVLPDPADPKAVRAEPLIERDRARVEDLPDAEAGDLVVEGQIEAVEDKATE